MGSYDDVAAVRVMAAVDVEEMWGGYPSEGVWVDDYEEPVFGRWGRGLAVGLSAHGLEFPVGVGELEASIWLFGAVGSHAGLMSGRERYCWFRKAVDLAFNNVDSIRRVVWNEWTVQMVRECCCDWENRKKFLAVAGSASCVSGDTRMLDPVTGEQPTIQSLCESETRPWVMTLHGPVLADVPYLKGEAELFEFVLSNGQKFKCTAEHRLLTETGWQFASSTNVGDWLYGYGPCPPVKSGETDLSDPRPNVLRSTGIPGGSQRRCSFSLRPDDGLLRLARGLAQGPLPSPDGVQTRNGCVCGRLGDPCGELGRNHPCQSDDLSTRSVSLRKWLSGTLSSLLGVVRTSLLRGQPFPPPQPSHQANIPLGTSSSPCQTAGHKPNMDCDAFRPVGLEFHGFLRCDQPSSLEDPSCPQPAECFSGAGTTQSPADSALSSLSISYPLKVGLVQVVSITNLGVERFYDLNVPVEHHYFSEGAIHHNSGKSDGWALIAMMLYWARPHETWVLVLSDTKSGARQRVWKSVTELWAQAERMGCPGVLVDSYGKIRGVNKLGNPTNNSGFELLAAGVDDADSACDRLKGIKNPQMVVLADEHTELGAGVFKTAYDNLTVNDRVVYAGMANPNLLSDSFADLAEPMQGWQSIDEGSYRWRTNYGWAVRFNAERSPRITQPDGERFHWQPDLEYCRNIAEKRGGVKSRGYYRYVKAWWCPEGTPNSIYSEVEMMNSVALHMREPDWDSPPTRLGSLDPAFSRGGNRNQAAVAFVGKVAGRTHLHIALEVTIEDDVMDKTVPLTHQIVRRWRDIMRDDWMIKPGFAIMDGTGGGMVVGDIVSLEWSPAVTKVNFKAKASGRTMQFRGEEMGFFNKNSEMWIQPKQFIRGNQISGISKETMAEMVGREFHKKEGRLLRVQDKEENKAANGGKSPDRADNVIMLIEHAINLGLLVSEEIKIVAKTACKGWSKLREKRQMSTFRGKRFR